MRTPVLLVDDSRAIRSLLVSMLGADGFETLEADTAQEALRIALARPPRVAIVDYHLPDMSGADLVRLLRASLTPAVNSIPVIGLSGVSGSERALMSAGATCFIAKPFHERDLRDALRSVLGGVAASGRK
ncbi:MAG TPA: response regulator [Anaeromyxobacteraceae bacterium]|nr:response regulator [Anaeromyxobacteraceae bacterium]